MEPIIVTGVGRSGTTILGEVFEHHPDVSYLFEFFSSNVRGFQENKHRIAHHEELDPAFAEKIRAAKWANPPAGKTLVVKDPRLIMHFNALRQVWPECRYVVIERDVRDVACSTHSAMRARKIPPIQAWIRKRKLGPGIEERCVGLPERVQIMLVVTELEKRSRISGPGTYRVSYEELISDPRGVVRPLFEQLGLWVVEPVARFLPRIADDVSVYVSPRSAGLFVKDHAKRVGRWREEFTDEEKRFARDHLGLSE